MRLPTAFAFAVLISFAPPAAACSCAWGGPFLEVVQPPTLVVVARVEAYGPELGHADAHYASMRIAVREVLGGNSRASTLTVFGDPGHLCRPYITPERFAAGQDYVLALHEVDDAPHAYAISGCGEFSLSLREGTVAGQITRERPQTMPLEKLRKRLRKIFAAPETD